MPEFYLTFGQKYRTERHPQSVNDVYPHPDGYGVIEAEDYETARAKVVEVFGLQWAFLYDHLRFDGQAKRYYPAGELFRITG